MCPEAIFLCNWFHPFLKEPLIFCGGIVRLSESSVQFGEYYFQAGSSGGDLFFVFEQRKSYGLVFLQPLPPPVERILFDAALLAKCAHALPDRFLFGYQPAPIRPPGLPHISNVPPFKTN
jgi:hypothetical protein